MLALRMSRSSRWIATNALAQALALALSSLVGGFANELLDDGVSEIAPHPAVTVLVMVSVGALEGAVVGSAQAWALRRGARWAMATAVAFAVGWALAAAASYWEPPSLPSRTALVLSALAAGAALGALIGALQYVAASAHRTDGFRGRWIGANTAGWAAGLLVSALAAQLTPLHAGAPLAMVLASVGGLGTGAVVGVVTAGVLPPPVTRS